MPSVIATLQATIAELQTTFAEQRATIVDPRGERPVGGTRPGSRNPGGAAFGQLVPASIVRPAGHAHAPAIPAQWPGTRRPTRSRRTPPGHSTMLKVAATCRMHGLDLFAYLAGVCTASMAGLAVPELLPAPA